MQPLPSAPSAATMPRDLRPFLDLLNQVFEIEKKVAALTETHSIGRNLNRMKNWFEHEFVATSGGQTVTFGFTYHNPLGEAYNETRTDCDASIAGSSAENLVITEVIKPIVWLSVNGQGRSIVQQAVVVVEGRPAAAGAETAAETNAETDEPDRQTEWLAPLNPPVATLPVAEALEAAAPEAAAPQPPAAAAPDPANPGDADNLADTDHSTPR